MESTYCGLLFTNTTGSPKSKFFFFFNGCCAKSNHGNCKMWYIIYILHTIWTCTISVQFIYLLKLFHLGIKIDLFLKCQILLKIGYFLTKKSPIKAIDQWLLVIYFHYRGLTVRSTIVLFIALWHKSFLGFTSLF